MLHKMMQLHYEYKKMQNYTKFSLNVYILRPATKAYQSLITRGRGQIFVMGRLKVPLGVWRVTTRTLLSLPG